MINSKDIFNRIVNDNIKREGIQDLMKWINNSDFFSTPASTRYHESYEGGLAKHSLNVFYQINKINTAYNNMYDKEKLAIVSLFHDICKIGCYKTELRNKKDETGQWIQVPFYTFNEDFKFGGHGSKSVYLIQHFLKLEPEEATAINCHMGVEGPHNIGIIYDSFRSYPLAFMLHMADVASTIEHLNKKEEN